MKEFFEKLKITREIITIIIGFKGIPSLHIIVLNVVF